MKLKLFFLVLIAQLCSTTVLASDAFDAKIDGIYYKFNGLEATVTEKDSNWNPETHYSDYTGDIVIPESVVYNDVTYRVTSINRYAFCDCDITSVTIPKTVTGIGIHAFEGCTNLTSIIIPDGVTSINEYCFANCSSLASVTMSDNVTNIQPYAFAYCYSLTSFVIPKGVTELKECFLYCCEGLTSVTIPEGVTDIQYHAFFGCTALTSITIPESVETINSKAFDQCFPKDVTIKCPTVGSCFQGVTSIRTITFGEKVRGLGSQAFKRCSNITDVYCYSEQLLQNTSSSAFNSASIENATLHVPSAYISTCKTVFPWRNFGTIVAIDAVDPIINFADATVKSLCLANWDTDGDGELSESEAAAVTSIETVFKENTEITTFDELQYFTGLTSIDKQAFFGCTNLTSVTIPKSVTSIGNESFGNSGLTNINIPNNVTTIGNYAFYYCKSLNSITIPASVTSIGTSAFGQCGNLASIQVENGNSNYDSRNGCNAIIETATNTLIRGCKNTIIPNGITSIGDYAFTGCSDLTEITIPDGVSSIGRDAFNYCKSLNYVKIPESVTAIGERAFYQCTNLAAIHITNLVAWCHISFENMDACPLMQRSLYLNDQEITNLIIPEGVTDISDFAFAGCSSFTSITLPKSATNIGYNAFRYCRPTSVRINTPTVLPWFKDMKTIDSVELGESVTSIGSGAFSGCTALRSIDIPNNVTQIDNSAFKGCNNLASVFIDCETVDNWFAGMTSIATLVLGDNVKTIKASAFSGCTGLSSVTMGNNVTSIITNAFYNCKALTSISMPKSVTYIGDGAFYNCNALTSISIPKSISYIGDNAFFNCRLTDVYCYAEEVPSPGTYPFSRVPVSTATLHVPAASLEAYKATAPWSKFGTIVAIDAVDPIINFADATVKSLCVANWDTDGDGELSEKEAAAVKSIGTVFKGNTEITSFEEFQFFTGITTIDENAFYGCKNLTSIYIPSSVTQIGESAFYNCSSLASVHIKSLVAWLNIDFSNGSSNPQYYAKRLYVNGQEVTDLIIPDGITQIKPFAFFDCTSLTSVAIPQSVTSIGDYAFSGCTGLTAITIPNSVTLIGKFVFRDCSNLASIQVENGNSNYDSRNGCNAIIETATNTLISGCKNTIIPDGITSIGISAFDGCSDLTSIIMPNGLISIEKCAFYGCSGLTSISIPNSLKIIGESAFNQCSSLTTITIPDGVTSIGSSAFSACSALACVHIPKSLTVIADYTFYYCRSLTSISIPKNITNIGYSAFISCQLSDVYCYAEEVPSTSSSFTLALVSKATLHVPAASLEAYKATAPWSKFGTIVAIDEPDDKLLVETFTLNCKRGYVGYNGSIMVGTTKANASELAIIEYNNTNYLYDVTNSAFVIYTMAERGDRIVANTCLESSIDLSKAITGLKWGETGISTYPWYIEDRFGNWMNMNQYPHVYMNTWQDFEGGNGGNTYQIEIVNPEYDATEVLRVLENYFNPQSTVTYVFTEPGDIVTRSKAYPTFVGTVVSSVPDELQKSYCSYQVTNATMHDGANEVNVQVSYTMPFTISESYETASWYYAKIRNSYYMNMGDSEPYYATVNNSQTDNYMWAFMGTPHSGFVILNKAAGATKGLTRNEDYVVMRSENVDRWEIIQNGEGFNILLCGSDADYINQKGNSSGPLGIWHDQRGSYNVGSQWLIQSVEPEDKQLVETFMLNCKRGYVGYDGTYLCGTSWANASQFAIIEYGGTNYLYDVTNSAFVIHTANMIAGITGNPLCESTTDIGKAVTGLIWGRTGYDAYPWYLEDCFGNWLNMDQIPRVYMNTWKDFEGGNGGNTYQKVVVEASYDASEALQILENYFNPKSSVTFVFVEPNATSQSQPISAINGTVINEVPVELRKCYCSYEMNPITVLAGNNIVNVAVSYDLPFTVSNDFESATWYYAKIRNYYYLNMGDSEPYYPTSAKQETGNFMWAFMGTPHTGFVILNKAAGADMHLAKDGVNVVMREEGSERWELIENGAGFNVLRKGSIADYINQLNNNYGPLGIWTDQRGSDNVGSQWLLEPIIPVIISDVEMSSTNDDVWYAPSGMRISKPVRGINIVRSADGSARKVLVK